MEFKNMTEGEFMVSMEKTLYEAYWFKHDKAQQIARRILDRLIRDNRKLQKGKNDGTE